MTSPCSHYDCTNRNSLGYCKTTACINPKYNRLSVESTNNTSATVIIKPITNGDRIRSMTDEELAKWLSNISSCCEYDECPAKDAGDDSLMFVKCSLNETSCQEAWLTWLRQEVDE